LPDTSERIGMEDKKKKKKTLNMAGFKTFAFIPF
jgi:hypothetical protein